MLLVCVPVEDRVQTGNTASALSIFESNDDDDEARTNVIAGR
jgi:hypothetical protein